MPRRAAAPVPAMIAVGVARPSAHGQAMTSTATASRIARCQSPVATPQPSSVTKARPITTGTNTALTRSTSRWIGAFLACADSTSRTMRASVDSAPTALARTSNGPLPLTEPPITCAPTATATGRLSPVTSDASTSLLPSTTRPSTAMRSPGRTTTSSPTATCAIGSSTSRPSRRTVARSGRSDCKARMADVVCRLARASSHLPRSTSVMTTAEASK